MVTTLFSPTRAFGTTNVLDMDADTVDTRSDAVSAADDVSGSVQALDYDTSTTVYALDGQQQTWTQGSFETDPALTLSLSEVLSDDPTGSAAGD